MKYWNTFKKSFASGWKDADGSYSLTVLIFMIITNVFCLALCTSALINLWFKAEGFYFIGLVVAYSCALETYGLNLFKICLSIYLKRKTTYG